MANTFKVVIVGGVAAGPKVASKVVRLNPNADVTVVEKGQFLSYAGCGLPYYVSGVVKDQKELMSTPVGVADTTCNSINPSSRRIRSPALTDCGRSAKSMCAALASPTIERVVRVKDDPAAS